VFYKPNARFFRNFFSEKIFFFKKNHEKWPKFDDFFKKKNFFGKIFWKKSRVWFIKHQGFEAESKIEKNFFFEKFKKMTKI